RLRGKRGCVSDSGWYEGLLSSSDVDQVIAFTRPKFGDATAFSAQAQRPKSYVQGWMAERPMEEASHFPRIGDLERIYHQGKTVVIMTMQQRWLSVAV